MRSYTLILFFFMLMSTTLSSQDSYHRLFNTFGNSSLLTASGVQLLDGRYASLNLLVTPVGDTITIDSVIITVHKPKGDVVWSTGISVMEDALTFGTVSANLVQGANDSLYFSVVSSSDIKPNKIIGSININGSAGWIKRISSMEELNDGTGGNFLTNVWTSLYAASGVEGHDKGDILLTRLKYNGDVEYGKLFKAFSDQDTLVSVLTYLGNSFDRNLLMAGIADTSTFNFFTTRMDTLGNVLWSKQYTDIQSFISVPIPLSATMLADSSVVVAGYFFAITNSFQFIFNGFVLKTDKKGDVAWSKRIGFNTDDATIIRSITTNRTASEIWLHGINQDGQSGEVLPFVLKMNDKGEVVFQHSFPRVLGVVTVLGEIQPTQDGGAVIFDTSIDSDKFATGLIKLDPNGNSMCHDTIGRTILFNHSFAADTLVWKSVDTFYSEKLTASANEYKLDFQAISFEGKTFCPNEPIDWTFRTPITGATLYEWSTGASGPMMDTLRVFAEGTYSVTVTVDDKVCYKLCDTTKIDKYNLPMVRLSESLGDWCTTGNMRIIADYTPGHPLVQSVVWSTGQTGISFIEAPQPGTYSVTVVDRCNETVSATYQLGPFPTKLSQVTINKNFSQFCNNATGILSAFGNATGPVATYRYQWSNGETTQSISVTQPGTYTVTMTDFCGTQAVGTITLPQSDFPTLTLNSLTSSLNNFCVDRGARLNLSFTGESSAIEWSTGARNVNSIVVSQTGTYSVTVSERTCPNNRISASINFVLPAEFDLISEVNLKATPDPNRNCELGFILIQAEYDGFARSVVWSSGATNTNAISVNEYREYSVTVRDTCNVFNKSIVIEAPEAKLEYANAFFPETIDTMTMSKNKTFGPFVKKGELCEGAIQNYEFMIFNRWGQKVFESNRLRDEWDGRYNDQIAPAEVYLWRARYTAYGIEYKLGGDVSLLRVTR